MQCSILAVMAALTVVNAIPNAYLTLEERQTGTVANDLKNGACKPVTFIMARGSTEASNMGTIAGPPTCAALKQQLGANQVACQGVGTEDGYPALLPPNFLPKNTDDTSIAAGTKLLTMAATKCPASTLVVGGYSQGSALVDNAIQGLPVGIQAKIAGVVLFGYTRNVQDHAQIPGYPTSQTKIFCAPGDLVCDDTLTITAAHLSYGANAPEAGKFLAAMVNAAGTGALSSPSTSPSTVAGAKGDNKGKGKGKKNH